VKAGSPDSSKGYARAKKAWMMGGGAKGSANGVGNLELEGVGTVRRKGALTCINPPKKQLPIKPARAGLGHTEIK